MSGTEENIVLCVTPLQSVESVWAVCLWLIIANKEPNTMFFDLSLV